jgi:hypothetical protein
MYSDLIYDKNGYNYFYFGNEEPLVNSPYKYLLILNGSWGNPLKEYTNIVLSDRADLTLNEVNTAMASSSTVYIKSIGRFKNLFFNYKARASNIDNLTLDDVKNLGDKGDSITMKDFSKYKFTDIGSGLYIMKYPINSNYFLLVGSATLEGKPNYVLLEHISTGTSIDIRTDDINEFLSK